MDRCLLVPLDGSAFGEQALPLALSIARRAGAALRLAHVHVPYAFIYGDAMSPGADEVDRQAQEQERVYLDAVVRRLASVSPVPVSSCPMEGIDVAAALDTYAVANKIELIIMTTHGRGPLSRFWIGSVADEFVRRASVPVLMVRPQQQSPDATSEPALRRILIPLDGTALAEHVLGPATALGHLMQADYTLLEVVGAPLASGLDPFFPVLGEFGPAPEKERADAEAYLRHVAERLQTQGPAVRTRVVSGRQPALAILEEAQAEYADLIALVTHGRRGLSRFLLGSVADKVLRGASAAVLICHAATP